MVVPSLGFSVGDFIAVISLINKVRKSLKEVDGGPDRYRNLLKDLDILSYIINSLKELGSESTMLGQNNCNALLELIQSCEKPLESFYKKTMKYHMRLGRVSSGSGGILSRIALASRGAQFSVIESSYVQDLRANISHQIWSISLLLSTVSCDSLNNLHRKLDSFRDTFEEKNTNFAEVYRIARNLENELPLREAFQAQVLDSQRQLIQQYHQLIETNKISNRFTDRVISQYASMLLKSMGDTVASSSRLALKETPGKHREPMETIMDVQKHRSEAGIPSVWDEQSVPVLDQKSFRVNNMKIPQRPEGQSIIPGQRAGYKALLLVGYLPTPFGYLEYRSNRRRGGSDLTNTTECNRDADCNDILVRFIPFRWFSCITLDLFLNLGSIRRSNWQCSIKPFCSQLCTDREVIELLTGERYSPKGAFLQNTKLDPKKLKQFLDEGRFGANDVIRRNGGTLATPVQCIRYYLHCNIKQQKVAAINTADQACRILTEYSADFSYRLHLYHDWAQNICEIGHHMIEKKCEEPFLHETMGRYPGIETMHGSEANSPIFQALFMQYLEPGENYKLTSLDRVILEVLCLYLPGFKESLLNRLLSLGLGGSSSGVLDFDLVLKELKKDSIMYGDLLESTIMSDVPEILRPLLEAGLEAESEKSSRFLTSILRLIFRVSPTDFESLLSPKRGFLDVFGYACIAVEYPLADDAMFLENLCTVLTPDSNRVRLLAGCLLLYNKWGIDPSIVENPERLVPITNWMVAQQYHYSHVVNRESESYLSVELRYAVCSGVGQTILRHLLDVHGARFEACEDVKDLDPFLNADIFASLYPYYRTGFTALMISIDRCEYETAVLLLQAGANITHKYTVELDGTSQMSALDLSNKLLTLAHPRSCHSLVPRRMWIDQDQQMNRLLLKTLEARTAGLFETEMGPYNAKLPQMCARLLESLQTIGIWISRYPVKIYSAKEHHSLYWWWVSVRERSQPIYETFLSLSPVETFYLFAFTAFALLCIRVFEFLDWCTNKTAFPKPTLLRSWQFLVLILLSIAFWELYGDS